MLLTERGLGGDAVDLTTRLEAFRRDRSPRAEDARRLARGLAQRAAEALTPGPSPASRREGALDALSARGESCSLGEGDRR